MKYLGMNKKEFLIYLMKRIKICIKEQQGQKDLLKKYNLDGVYDQ